MLAKTRYLRIWKTALLPFIDFISINLGILMAFAIRFRWLEDSFSSNQRLSFGQYLFFSSLISFLTLFIYSILGLYNINSKKTLARTAFNLVFGLTVVLLAVIAYFFFNEYNRDVLPSGVLISRFVLAVGGFVSLFIVLLGRFSFFVLEKILYKAGFGRNTLVVIGDDNDVVTSYLQENHKLDKIYNFKSLETQTLTNLTNLIDKEQVGEIYLLNDEFDLGAKLALIAERSKINFIFSPRGLKGYQSFGLNTVTIKNKLFLELKHSNLDGWAIVAKRLFDIIFSALFLILFSWLYLIIAILIKLDSNGPIFYKNQRVAPNGKPFYIWKFRRLKQEFCVSEDNLEALEIEKNLVESNNSKKDDVLYKILDDPRSTKIGNILEKLSLDELPQFINVFFGDLSLVGPRPHQPREVSKYSKHHFKVLNISPGLTGLAQINGRSDLSFEEEVKYDLYYIEKWSFWLDIWIILQTPFVILLKRHGQKDPK